MAKEELDLKLSFEEPDENLIKELEQEFNNNRNNYDIAFQYALVLSKSRKIQEKENAVSILKSLLNVPKFRTDILYIISECLYSMKSYEEARLYCEELLRQNPDSVQAKNLHNAIRQHIRIEEQQTTENLYWAAGSVGVLVIGLGILLASRKS